MRGTLQQKFVWARTAGVAGLGALFFTAACGTSQNAPGVAAQTASAQPSTPVVVACEPNQRTLVRPVVINGNAVSQVECVSTGDVPLVTQNTVAQPTPVTYYRAPVARNGELTDTRYVPAASYPVATSPRVTPARQVVYDDRPVRQVPQGRSVKKSAVIIGSSAGIGAGVGAAIHGKKGALIGAAIGGGGAAIWDQMTRRNDR
jgi:hypothetical protein